MKAPRINILLLSGDTQYTALYCIVFNGYPRCSASCHLPLLSFSEYQMSCELFTERYLVFSGWSSTMKKSLFPSGEIVGLNSGNLLFTRNPRFSILMMVFVPMTFSFCCLS